MSQPVVSFHPRTERRLSAARRVHDLLRSAIIRGELRAGVLPGEAELMVAFSASRQVVRDALDLLRREGLVRRLQGTGTLATSTRVRHDFNFLHGPEQGRVEHRLLGVSREVAAPQVARELGLAAGEECGVVEMLSTLEDEPFYTSTTYVPAAFLVHAEGLGPHDEWFTIYERTGIELGTTEHAIEASVADPFTAALLDVEEGHPLLLFERVVRDLEGTPLEYAFTQVRGDRLTLQQTLSRRSPDGAWRPAPG